VLRELGSGADGSGGWNLASGQCQRNHAEHRGSIDNDTGFASDAASKHSDSASQHGNPACRNSAVDARIFLSEPDHTEHNAQRRNARFADDAEQHATFNHEPEQLNYARKSEQCTVRNSAGYNERHDVDHRLGI